MSAQILDVEKNEKIGGLICAQLREKGHEVRDCRNGPEAVLELRKNGADVILLDNAIPMGAVKTARILRLHEKYNHIGLPPEKKRARVVIKEGQAKGIVHFLLKPFTLTALQKKLTEVLESGATVEKPNEPGYSRRDQEPVEPAGHAGGAQQAADALEQG
jgi:CheY-like chemotaxis protein